MRSLPLVLAGALLSYSTSACTVAGVVIGSSTESADDVSHRSVETVHVVRGTEITLLFAEPSRPPLRG